MRGTHEDRGALLSRLIDHYRDVGWWIERPAIAGVDLRLRRDAKVLLLACADPHAPATRETVDALRRSLVEEAVDGALLVAPAGLEAVALDAAQGVEALRVLDRDALQGLLGDDTVLTLPVSAPGAITPPARAIQGRRRTTGLDWLFRAIGVLCALGFLLTVLVLLSRTSGTAGEPPPDPASASKR